MSVTTGMTGHGEYNLHSAPQMAAIEYVAPWLEQAVASMALTDPPETVGLADFGCSEGRNSIAIMRCLVAALRNRTSRPIQTVHSDLPTNDYSELMRALRHDGRSVYEAEDVYSAAVGGSMFDRLLPPRSLHVATTFNAIGFLSRRPVERLPGYIIATQPKPNGSTGEVSEDDRLAFARQARADIESFVTARASELVPGGKLLIQVFGAGDVSRTCDGIFDALNDALLETLAAGLIDRDGYERFYHPVYFRTLPELTAPLVDPASPCSKLFETDRQETYEVPVSFVEMFRESGDVKRFAREYTEFFRVFTEPVLRLTFAEHRALDKLIGEIFGRAERLIRDNPDRYEFHYIALAVLLTRR